MLECFSRSASIKKTSIIILIIILLSYPKGREIEGRNSITKYKGRQIIPRTTSKNNIPIE
jgi:hypothetical protein